MIKPINNNILIELNGKNSHPSLLLMSESVSKNEGIVKNISPGEREIKIGDRVIFDLLDAHLVNDNHILVHRSKILGIKEGKDE